MKKQKGISTSFAILVVGIIAIIGFSVFYSYQYIWTSEEETITPKTEKSAEEVSVPEDWKTYRNKEYGFEIKHPHNEETLSFAESSKGMTFAYFYPSREEGNVLNTIYFEVEDNPQNLSISQWISKNENCNVDASLYQKIELDCVEGIKVEGPAVCPPGASGIVYKAYLPYRSKVYSVELLEEIISDKSEECAINQKRIFDQMLSSFKFTEIKNEPLNFLLPQKDQRWKIGEEKNILLNQVLSEIQPPFYHLSLFNENGKELGIIKCKIGSLEENSFKWEIDTLLNYCGAGLEGKTSSVSSGKYKIGLIKDVEGRPIIAESDYFFIEE